MPQDLSFQGFFLISQLSYSWKPAKQPITEHWLIGEKQKTSEELESRHMMVKSITDQAQCQRAAYDFGHSTLLLSYILGLHTLFPAHYLLIQGLEVQ